MMLGGRTMPAGCDVCGTKGAICVTSGMATPLTGAPDKAALTFTADADTATALVGRSRPLTKPAGLAPELAACAADGKKCSSFDSTVAPSSAGT